LRVVWLAVLLVMWSVLAVSTEVLAVIIGVQKVMQLRRPKVEILPPPNWPDPWTERFE
jgi:hypothetical protein